MRRLFTAICFALLCLGMTCKTPDKPAAATAGKSALPSAIAASNSNHVAALQAATAVAADAAASVSAIAGANAVQPPGPNTEFIDAEAKLALDKLPPPDAAAVIKAAARREALLAGDRDKFRQLYGEAQSEGARLKSEAETAKARASESAAALVAAERSHAAALERSRAENQARMDELAAKLKKSEDDRKNAETKEQVKWLRIIGLCCLVAGIGIGVMTNGIQLAKSIGFGACALACFGLAQIVAHPWFLPVSIGCLVLAVAGGGYWFWREREDSFKAAALAKQAGVLQRLDPETVPMPDEKGNPSTLAAEFSKKMDTPEKRVVKKLVADRTVQAAKAEAKS